MRIVFFGTSQFAADILSFMFDQHLDVVAVVTRMDRPAGRRLRLTMPPVKKRCLQEGLDVPIYQPQKASTPEFVETLKALAPDLLLVVAYGEIIKQSLLDLPRQAAINIHPSLLPLYRGPSPIQQALMDGVDETGVTLIRMGLKMDAGDIVSQARIAVSPNTTFPELEKQLCDLSCKMVLQLVHNYAYGVVTYTPQEHSRATFVQKITRETARISWNCSATQIHNLVRALTPKPGAWTQVNIGGKIKTLKILETRVVEPVNTNLTAAGTTLHFSAEQGWIVSCQEGALSLLSVQLEGKLPLSAKEWARGLRCPPLLA